MKNRFAPQRDGLDKSFVSKKVHPAYFMPAPTMPASDESAEPDAFDIAGLFVHKMTAFDLDVKTLPGDSRYLKAIGLRCVARQWVVDPSVFDGLSLRQLAMRLGVKATSLSNITAEFSRVFHISNAFKCHDSKGERQLP